MKKNIIFFMIIIPFLDLQAQTNLVETNSSPLNIVTNNTIEIPQTNKPIISPLPQMSTNSIPLKNFNTNIIKKINPQKKKNTRMVNLIFSYLLSENAFSQKFTEANNKDGTYYHLPFNSWNDPFYITISFDWLSFPSFYTRFGWELGMNFAGSGNGSGSIEVPLESDLGKAHHGIFYAYYKSYNFPLLLNLRIQPLHWSIFKFYAGFGLGSNLGFYTYNELIEKEPSLYDTDKEKTFILFPFLGQVFIGINFNISESFNTMVLEVKYRFIKNPIVKNDFLEPLPRRVSYQVSGLSIGFGFRY